MTSPKSIRLGGLTLVGETLLTYPQSVEVTITDNPERRIYMSPAEFYERLHALSKEAES